MHAKRSAMKQRTANVRDDGSHAPASLVIDATIALVPKDPKLPLSFPGDLLAALPSISFAHVRVPRKRRTVQRGGCTPLALFIWGCKIREAAPRSMTTVFGYCRSFECIESPQCQDGEDHEQPNDLGRHQHAPSAHLVRGRYLSRFYGTGLIIDADPAMAMCPN
jgi:hypothetical protein